MNKFFKVIVKIIVSIALWVSTVLFGGYIAHTLAVKDIPKGAEQEKGVALGIIAYLFKGLFCGAIAGIFIVIAFLYITSRFKPNLPNNDSGLSNP